MNNSGIYKIVNLQTNKYYVGSTKDFKQNNYKQLACQCNLPRPNSFTGNCTSCNKIIKPIIDKDADKYTK